MRVDVNDLMEQTVTVCNCIPATEAGSEDTWHTATLTGFWHWTGESTSATEVVKPATTADVQIAEEDADGYVDPGEYSGEGWTLRPGDLLVLGAVSCTGTRSELADAIGSLPTVTVTKAEDLRLGDYGHGLNGLAKWASILYARGE